MYKASEVRKNIDWFASKFADRNYPFDKQSVLTLLNQHKEASDVVNRAREERNQSSETYKSIFLGTDEQAKQQYMDTAKRLQQDLLVAEAAFSKLDWQVAALMASLPNLASPQVQVGVDEQANVEVSRWLPGVGYVGTDQVPEQKPFEVKDHVKIGESMGLDLELAGKLSGSRFAFMKGPIASLHRALAQYMLNLHVNAHGYQECYTPYLVDSQAMIGTGQFPKFTDDVFKVERPGREPQYLISTSEITLTNSVQNTVLNPEDLPIKLVAHTPCFRSEAGSAGRDTRGLIRQHQFDKVEMVQIVDPDSSYQALEAMRLHAEAVLQGLELPYRVVRLCTGDMGFSAAMTYDLEVWVPSQNTWREISSVSNCEAFQANRMKARMKKDGQNVPVHTLNGSGVAVGRALVAVLENHQNSDGTLTVPKVLAKHSFLPEVISPNTH